MSTAEDFLCGALSSRSRSLAALLATALPAYAMLGGDGTLTVDRDGNTISAVEVSGLEVPRGMVPGRVGVRAQLGGQHLGAGPFRSGVHRRSRRCSTVTDVELLTDAVVKNGNGGTVALGAEEFLSSHLPEVA